MTKILETLSPPFRGGIYLLYRMLSAMRDGNEFLPSVPLCRVVTVVPARGRLRPATHSRNRVAETCSSSMKSWSFFFAVSNVNARKVGSRELSSPALTPSLSLIRARSHAPALGDYFSVIEVRVPEYLTGMFRTT